MIWPHNDRPNTNWNIRVSKPSNMNLKLYIGINHAQYAQHTQIKKNKSIKYAQVLVR